MQSIYSSKQPVSCQSHINVRVASTSRLFYGDVYLRLLASYLARFSRRCPCCLIQIQTVFPDGSPGCTLHRVISAMTTTLIIMLPKPATESFTLLKAETQLFGAHSLHDRITHVRSNVHGSSQLQITHSDQSN